MLAKIVEHTRERKKKGGKREKLTKRKELWNFSEGKFLSVSYCIKYFQNHIVHLSSPCHSLYIYPETHSQLKSPLTSSCPNISFCFAREEWKLE